MNYLTEETLFVFKSQQLPAHTSEIVFNFLT